MKKLLLIAIAIVASVSAYAYDYLCINKTDGYIKAYVVDGLTLTVSGDNLVITNDAGQQATEPLAELASMEFSNEATGVNDALADADTAVTLFTIDGVALGEFSSLNAALNSLSNGVYVIKKSNGETVKILISK